MKAPVIVVAAVVVIAVVAGVAFVLTRPEDVTTPPPGGADNEGEYRVFDMTAEQFSFNPSTITVNQGDNVKLRITSIDVPHGISIPAFGINATLPQGEIVTVQFLAASAGTYPFSCSVFCGAGHSSMVGQIVVQ